jgi:hypothetical protein
LGADAGSKSTPVHSTPSGPNEIVEVFSSKPMRWQENLVTISGSLVIINDGGKGDFFPDEGYGVKLMRCILKY